MALRNILINGDEALRKVCRPVTDFGGRTAELMDDLLDTVKHADGAGLAAPQVGILRRAVVIIDNDSESFVELINPEIIERSDELEGAYEGCLSCPDKRALIERPVWVTVRALDRNGAEFTKKCVGLSARSCCHELDHLDGRLFIDLADRVYTERELDEMEDGD